MKKGIALLLALILALSLAACGSSAKTPEESAAPVEVPKESEEVVGMANPWTEYASLEEAEAAAGFKFPQPKWDVSFDTVTYRAMDGVIEVVYSQDDGQVMTLRKGADETDISGDYNAYAFTGTSEDTQTGRVIEIKGEDAAKCSAATWTEDGHFYAFDCGLPLEIDRVIDLVHAVIGAQAG